MGVLALVNMLLAINLHKALGKDATVLGALSDSKCDDIVKDPYLFGLSYNGIFVDRTKAQILIDSYNISVMRIYV